MYKLILIIFTSLVSFNVFPADCKGESDLAIKALCEERLFSDLLEIEEYLLDGESREDTGVYYSDTKLGVGDINNDGTDEIILTAPGCSKNCEHILVIKEKTGYRFIGIFYGVSIRTVILPDVFPIGDTSRKVWNGFKYLTTYNYGGRMGAGRFDYSAFNGVNYVSIGSFSFNTGIFNSE